MVIALPRGSENVCLFVVLKEREERYRFLHALLPDVIRQSMRTYSVRGSSGWTTGIGERSDAVYARW